MNPEPLDTLVASGGPAGNAVERRPAGLVARSEACLIDAAIRVAILIAASVMAAQLQRFGTGLLLALFLAIEWIYPVAFELLPGAATPGKRVAGLRVVMDSGQRVTPAASMLRNLLRAVDFLPLGYAIGGTLLLLRPDFKRLGDLAAGTLVVHTTRQRLAGPLPAAEPVAPPRDLSSREQAAVLGWAGRAGRLTEARLAELALLAGPLTAAGATQTPQQATQRLLGIAQWLARRRPA